MTRRKSRHLSPSEREMWEQVARTTKPLSPVRKTKAQPPEAAAPVEPPVKKPIAPDFTIGASPAPKPPAKAPGPPSLRMDKRRFDALRRGKHRPEGRIDLHGMTVAQAHPALIRFVQTAYAANKRLILVITGKGSTQRSYGDFLDEPGVLRRQLPFWLAQPPLSSIVLEFTTSHRRHGGDGAYYVYLRK